MKVVNSSISPLPFYDDISEQNHRKEYAYGNIYTLTTPLFHILPFQVWVFGTRPSVTRAIAHSMSGGAAINITDSLIRGGLQQDKTDGNYRLIRYPDRARIPELSTEGRYYLELLFDDGTSIYSDVYTLSADYARCVKLQYGNSIDFRLKDGFVDFSDNFKFTCYLDAQIGKPEYDFEEESTVRMGYTYMESQVSKKVYRFTTIAPEYLCDALRLVRLCDSKTITSLAKTYEALTYSMKVEWQEQGDLAAVESEFETDTVVVNIGGHENLPSGKDFNIDFDPADFLANDEI